MADRIRIACVQLTSGRDKAANLEKTERLVAQRFDWAEAWAMLQRGEITDSLSVIAVLHEAVRRLENLSVGRV